VSKDQKEQEPENALEEKLTREDLDNMSRRDLVELLEAYNELLAEVKRLRERLDLAERYIIEPTLTRNYFADVVSKGLDDERDNLG
jgi:hypothetical protein